MVHMLVQSIVTGRCTAIRERIVHNEDRDKLFCKAQPITLDKDLEDVSKWDIHCRLPGY